MAELTEETVKKLNRLLERLARDTGRDRPRRGSETAGADSGPRPHTPSASTLGDLTEKEAEKKIEELAKKLGKLDKAAERTEKSYSSMTESIDKAFKLEEIEIAKEHALEYQKILEKLKVELQGVTEDTDDWVAAQKKADKALDALNDKTEDASAKLGAEDGLSKELAQVGQKMLGLNIESGGATEKLMNIGKKFKDLKAGGGSLSKALGKAGKSIGLSFAVKIMDQFIETTKELMKQQDQAISSFRKATGAGKEYNLEMAATERRNFAAGVSALDAGKAYNVLYDQFSQFTQLNQAERENLVDTTILLDKLGVQMGTSAKIMDQLSRALGLGPDSLNETMLRLAGGAKELGVSMDKMASDFAGAFTELSKYGDRAIDVFEGLAKQSKATGLAVGDLMGIAKQFDEFDTAAKAVGRLNAIMGGPYLNAIDMLNASEAERIELLRDSVDVAGVQWESMNRFEKQAMASALGMNVEQASRIMKMSTDEMKLQALEQEQLQELARDSQEIMEQIKNAMKALAIDFRPLIEKVIVPMIEGLGTFAQWLGGAESGLARFIKMGLIAGSIAAVIAAPFTGGTSLAMWAGIAALAGGGAYAAFGGSGGGGGSSAEMDASRYAGFQGGTDVNQTIADRMKNFSLSGAQNRRVNVSEIGSEELTVPDRTIVRTYQDLSLEVEARKEMQKTLNAQTGFLKEMAAGNQGNTFIKLDDGTAFSTTVTRQGSNALFSPFGGRHGSGS